MKYLWERDNWTEFKWNRELILESISNARKGQGYILAKGETLNLQDIGEFISNEAIKTSEIEGEILDKDSVRSSVANRLGLPTAGLPRDSKKTDGLIDVLLDATTNYNKTLNSERLFSWHAALFPTGYSGINRISVGKWREGEDPMEIVSGDFKNINIHYVAPPSSMVQKEMDNFFTWWSNSKEDGIIRAAISHFWFVTIHPFDDGNGRIARAITDMALAQDEKTGKRLYSLSSQIVKEKSEYYKVLEDTQKGDGDITNWLLWFLNMYSRSIESSKNKIEHSSLLNRLFNTLSGFNLNQRQLKVMKKLIESCPEGFEGGLTNRKYVSITKTSSESAKRDIKKLVELKLLKKNQAKGRSTSYSLGEFLFNN